VIARTSPSALRPPPPVRGTRLDGGETVVDSLEQVRLFRERRHGQTNEVVGEANVREDAAGVVVEVQKGARVQLEDPWTRLAKHRTGTELLE